MRVARSAYRSIWAPCVVVVALSSFATARQPCAAPSHFDAVSPSVATAGRVTGLGTTSEPLPSVIERDGRWSVVHSPWKSGHIALYDAERDRMIIFGGGDASFETDALWSLSFADSRWSRLETIGENPGPRLSHAAALDREHDRIIVVGGYSGPTMNDAWTLSLAGMPIWRRIVTTGAPAGPRAGHTAIYDPIRNRVLVYGGLDGSDAVWSLWLDDDPRWEVLAVAGQSPGPRSGHGAVYDPVRDRMVVFGGGPSTDTWALLLAGAPRWERVLTPGLAPSGWLAHTALYDPLRDRLVIVAAALGVLPFAAGSSWSQILPGGELPSIGMGSAAVYDSRRDRIVVTGASDLVWTVDLAAATPAWSRLSAPGAPPAARQGHSAVFDSKRQRILVFGGATSSGFLAETWAYDLLTDEWRSLETLSGPPPRGFHAAVYDPELDRMIVFGGFAASGQRNDVWALWLEGEPFWSRLEPAGAPPEARWGHSGTYDAERKRMIVFGGYGTQDGALDDTWTLELGFAPVWRRLSETSARPLPRAHHAVACDSGRGCLVLFGGELYTEAFIGDTWRFDLASDTWSPVITGGGPSPRGGASAVIDPRRDRLVIFGGQDFWESSSVNDVWELPLADVPALWRRLQPEGVEVGPRRDHSVVYDPARRRMFVFAGHAGWGQLHSDVAILAWPDPTAAFPLRVLSTRLRAAYPNPFNPRTSLPFDLATPGRARLEVLDVKGRLVRVLQDGELPTGNHVCTWDGRDAAGRAVSSGSYIVRLCTGSWSGSRRLVLIR